MYSLCNQFNRLYTASGISTELFKVCNANVKRDFIFASGILNFLWQSWNRFWRTFWLCYLLGGEDFRKNKIFAVPSLLNRSEAEAIYYTLYILGKRSSPFGSILGSFQEPTWGDMNVIINIANQVNLPGTQINTIKINVLNALSVLGDTPKHFQIVRNASIHLDKDNINNIKIDVVPYYTIGKFKYPTEILFAKELKTNKIAYQHWVDDLLAVLSLIFL